MEVLRACLSITKTFESARHTSPSSILSPTHQCTHSSCCNGSALSQSLFRRKFEEFSIKRLRPTSSATIRGAHAWVWVGKRRVHGFGRVRARAHTHTRPQELAAHMPHMLMPPPPVASAHNSSSASDPACTCTAGCCPSGNCPPSAWRSHLSEGTASYSGDWVYQRTSGTSPLPAGKRGLRSVRHARRTGHQPVGPGWCPMRQFPGPQAA